MYKKFLLLFLCVALINSVGYADTPFEDKTLATENTAASSDLETADITVKEDTSGVSGGTQEYENWILNGNTTSTDTNSDTNTSTNTSTSTSTNTSSDTSTSTSTSTSTNTSSDTSVATNTDTSATTGTSTSTTTSTTKYTVVSGDYLIKICQNLLGDGSRWPELVELNKDRYPSLVSNPNLIYAGWELVIPGTSSGSSSSSNSSSGSSSSSGSNNSSSSDNGSSSSDNNNTTVNPSASDSSNVSAGKAPVRAVDSPSGAPALIYQSAPSGSGVNTKSAEFKDWFNSALDTYGDWNMPAVKNQYGQTISVEMYMKAILFIESNGTHRKSDGSLVKSYCGAQGFMQLMPATASELGVDGNDPKQNLAGGCKLFQKIFSGSYGSAGKKTGVDKLMLVACSYNAGPWSSLVKGSWQDLKNTGSSVQGYGIKLKMCLGLELEEDEKTYAKNPMQLTAMLTLRVMAYN